MTSHSDADPSGGQPRQIPKDDLPNGIPYAEVNVATRDELVKADHPSNERLIEMCASALVTTPSENFTFEDGNPVFPHGSIAMRLFAMPEDVTEGIGGTYEVGVRLSDVMPPGIAARILRKAADDLTKMELATRPAMEEARRRNDEWRRAL